MKAWPLILLLLTAIPLALTWDRDLIPVNQGFGWDGKMYGMYTQHLPEAFEQKAINSHRIQRILVPAALHYILKALDIPRTEAAVIQAYRVSNALFILLAALAFLALARAAAWHWSSTTLGYGALFWSVPVLKMSLFYPLLPDLPAMAMGMLAMLCWYRHWRVGLLLVILAGSFTGPTMMAYGLLLLFPRVSVEDGSRTPVWWWGVLPLLFLGSWAWAWIQVPEAFNRPPSGSQPVGMTWLPLSLPLALLWMAGLSALLALFRHPREWLGNIPWGYWFALGIVAVIVREMIRLGSGTEAPPQTLVSYLQGLMAQSVTWPGAFLVAHFQYLPGLVLIGALALPVLRNTLSALGTGALLLTLGLGILLLGSETRQLMQLLPWAAFLFTHTLDRHWRLPAWLPALWTAGLLAGARWWERLGTHSLEEPFLQGPAQRYFRFHGPWMNQDSWLSTLLLLLVCLALIYYLWKKGFITLLESSAARTA
jgi:hypothetical protein